MFIEHSGAASAPDPLPLSIAVALDTSASMRGDRFRYAREAIGRLIDRLNPQDETAIYGFNNWPYQITSWTSSHSAAVMALSDEQPMARGGFTALFEAVRVGLNLLDSAAARRRALLVISDGNEELPGDQWMRGGNYGHALFRRTDLRDQYLIGFVPTHPADGKFHKLQVTVRGCDCHARSRAGFVHSR